MYEIDIKLNTDQVVKSYSKANQKKYVGALQLGMAQYMSLVKMRAIKEIIPNSTGRRKPGPRMFKAQPVHPTKLTERTGRMIAGLREGGGPSEQQRSWQGWGNRIVKTNTNVYGTLNGMIKATTKGNLVDHRGTYTPYIRWNSAALKKVVRNYRFDTKQQAAVKYQHENGIRGRRRPFMWPSAQKNLGQLKRYVETQTSLAIRRF